MVEEIEFENHHFCNFKSHMTLTLTSDDLESHIIVNVSSTLTNTAIWFVAALFHCGRKSVCDCHAINKCNLLTYLLTYTHTHTTVLLLFWNMSGTTRVSRYQKGKTRKVKPNLDLLEQETVSGSGISWANASLHLIPDNHANIPPLSFLQAGCPSCRPTNSVKALKAFTYLRT